MISATLVAMVMPFLAACGTSAPYMEPQTATATPKPTPTPTLVLLADCFLSFHVAAWQDLNGDGLWDASEPPLEGVEFRLQGAFAQIWGEPHLSEADGRLSITTWSPGRCTEQDYAITAIPPESYELTTPGSITFTLSPSDSFYAAQFGFRVVPK